MSNKPKLIIKRCGDIDNRLRCQAESVTQNIVDVSVFVSAQIQNCSFRLLKTLYHIFCCCEIEYEWVRES